MQTRLSRGTAVGRLPSLMACRTQDSEEQTGEMGPSVLGGDEARRLQAGKTCSQGTLGLRANQEASSGFLQKTSSNVSMALSLH